MLLFSLLAEKEKDLLFPYGIAYEFATSDRQSEATIALLEQMYYVSISLAVMVAGIEEVAKMMSLSWLSRISSLSALGGGLDQATSSAVNGVNATSAFLDVTREMSRYVCCGLFTIRCVDFQSMTTIDWSVSPWTLYTVDPTAQTNGNCFGLTVIERGWPSGALGSYIVVFIYASVA
ncbi:hypothetical protein V7S43_002352 [Phytophthora oleae]|uniref:Uncharacterized protein n=1 Tax=Phytophthora oleae TaxID=2107226 RepID=A0ABD3G4C0_9STRA